MNYRIKEIAGVINASCHIVSDMAISCLLTDSRAITIPENTLFFASGFLLLVEMYFPYGAKFFTDAFTALIFLISIHTPFIRKSGLIPRGLPRL